MSSASFFWFRIIPGIITIVLLTSPLWTSFLGIYDVILLYLGFVSCYLTYKSAQTAITNVIGYRWMQRDIARNWKEELKRLDFTTLPQPEQLPRDLSQIYHLLFIPFYKEPFDLLDKTFQAIASQDYLLPKNIIVVAAVEERAGEEQKKVMARLKKKYGKILGGVWDFYHPFGIPGEVIGDACANLRWAGIKATDKLAESKISSKNVIFTKFDSDTRIHPKFISALTYTYLTTERRMNSFFGPGILLYSNNQWRVPAVTRVLFSTLSLGVLNEWIADRGKKQSFSCYSANMRILEKIDYWDASTGAEDTYFYWNAILHLDGDLIGHAFYLPVTMDAVEGRDFWSAVKSLYKQQLRWGWGALIMPIALQGMAWNKKIRMSKKLQKFAVLFRAYSFMLTGGILISITTPILTLINHDFGYSSISYNLPRIISYLLTASLIFQLPAKYYIYKFYGAPPKERSFWFKAWWWVLEPFMMFVNIWTYYLFPRVQALYELTVGKNRKTFIVAIEGRMEKNV